MRICMPSGAIYNCPLDESVDIANASGFDPPKLVVHNEFRLNGHRGYPSDTSPTGHQRNVLCYPEWCV